MNLRIYVTRQEIQARVQEIAKKLKSRYREVCVVCVLKGAYVFCADLMRALSEIKGPKVTLEFLIAKSYEKDQSSGDVRIEYFDGNVKDKDVLIVEDIVDTGLTIMQICTMMGNRGAKSVSVCTLLDKPSRRKVDVKPDFVGFEIPNNFAVGYGMDYEGQYRELDYIGVID